MEAVPGCSPDPPRPRSRSSPATSPTADALRAGEACSAIVVPLRARGRALGALSLALRAPVRRRYEEDDLEFARVLSGRAGLALDNAGLFTELETVEARLSAALGSLAEAVTVQDRRGRLVYANDAAAALLGVRLAPTSCWRPRPPRSSTATASFTDDGRPLEASRTSQAAGCSPGEQPELAGRSTRSTRDGRASAGAIVKATAVLDRDGRPELAVNVVEDITTVKRAEIAPARPGAGRRAAVLDARRDAGARPPGAASLVPELADGARSTSPTPKGLPLAPWRTATRTRSASPGSTRSATRRHATPRPARAPCCGTGRPELLEITDALLHPARARPRAARAAARPRAAPGRSRSRSSPRATRSGR